MNNLFEKELVIASIKQSFVKLDPRQMIKNPIMFTVEICTAVMLPVTIYSAFSSEQGSFAYNAWVLLILFVTLLFANFAEAIAEARGKAQADSLRKTREETPAKLYVNGNIKTVSSSSLKKGDEFVCDAGDVIPADGEIVEGLASIDESAITGESAQSSAKPVAIRAVSLVVQKCLATISVWLSLRNLARVSSTR